MKTSIILPMFAEVAIGRGVAALLPTGQDPADTAPNIAETIIIETLQENSNALDRQIKFILFNPALSY